MKYSFYIISLISSFFICLSCGHNHDENEDDHEEDHHHSSGIVIEPEKAAEFGIELETVTPGNFNDVIKTSGIIEASGEDIFTATAKRSGIITLSSGVTTGSAVKSGERIATVSSEGVQGGDMAKAAAANLAAAKLEYERLKPLYEDGLVTASTFREAERAYNEAQALVGKGSVSAVVAPGSGNIIDLFVKNGEYVEVGEPVATIGKNSTQVLKIDLPLRESKHLSELETANFIPEGSSEVLRLKDLNGKKISGKNASTAKNGYIPVYFSFNANGLTASGGFAEVFLICGEKEDVISVPRQALIEIQGNKYVYVAVDDHGYDKRLVETGASDGERIEIRNGIKAGDKIVAKGASIVRMAEVSAIAPPAHTHNH